MQLILLCDELCIEKGAVRQKMQLNSSQTNATHLTQKSFDELHFPCVTSIAFLDELCISTVR